MWKKFVALAAFVSASLGTTAAFAGNSEPIILVHGFAGWGRGEMMGLKYWGGGWSGSGDLQTWLTNNGYTTYTAAVGPVSSNWDRAIELFYQIKGGCVDYGPYHSANVQGTNGAVMSHYRKVDATGVALKCYPGLYPQWDANHKVHFVTHSMGGQTVRQLMLLLKNGSPNDLAADSSLYDESVQANPFTGGKSWVHSVTTIASPHNGTTLASLVQLMGPVQQIVGGVAALGGLTSYDSQVYDFKLEQWGLKRDSTETLTSYMNRVQASSFWTSSYDISLWDLSPDGAKQLNDRDQMFSDVYYFAFTTKSTVKGLGGYQYPILSTFTPFMLQSALMGSFTRPGDGVTQYNIDSTWWDNDSVVNTISQRAPAPFVSGCVNWSAGVSPTPGQWYFMGQKKGWDHLDATGLFTTRDVTPMYAAHANRLWGLN